MVSRGKNLAKRVLVIFYYLLYAHVVFSLLFRKAHRSGVLSYISDGDYIVWKRAILRMFRRQCLRGHAGWRTLVEAFCRADIIVIRKNEVDPEKNLSLE